MASDDQQQHALQTAWSVWEQRELGKGMAYADKLFKLCTFRTVEEFWSYWNNIPKPRCVRLRGYVHVWRGSQSMRPTHPWAFC